MGCLTQNTCRSVSSLEASLSGQADCWRLLPLERLCPSPQLSIFGSLESIIWFLLPSPAGVFPSEDWGLCEAGLSLLHPSLPHAFI